MVKGFICEYNSERRRHRGLSDKSPTASSPAQDARQEQYHYPVASPSPDAVRSPSGPFDGTHAALDPLGIAQQSEYPGMSR